MPASSLLFDQSNTRQLVPFYDGHRYHLLLRDGNDLLHGASGDLLNWDWQPPQPAPPSWSEAGACLVRHQGQYYLFYSTADGIGRVNSPDLETWQGADDQEVLTARQPIYRPRCRDPFVFFHQAEGVWWMLFSGQVLAEPEGRAGCIGLAKSANLTDWQLAAPLWAPGLSADCDAPHLLEHAHRWYLLYRKHEAHYRIANAAGGPYRRPPLRYLYSNQVAEGTRAVWDGNAWCTFPLAAGPAGSGTPAIPRQLTFQLDGSVTEQPARLLLNHLRQRPVQNTGLNHAQRLRGEWKPLLDHTVLRCTSDHGGILRLPDTGGDCLVKADILFEKEDMELHLLVRTDEELTRGYQVTFEPRSGQVSLRHLLSTDPRPLATRWVPLPVNKPLQLQIFLIGNLLDLFIDDRSSLTAQLSGASDGAMQIEYRDGKGKIGNLEIRRWR